jgi:hypothetical protein
MSTDDYEQIANETAGPDASEALRYMAEALHRGESMHTHAEIQQDVCSYCWLRAGRAMRAVREFSGHPYFAEQQRLRDLPPGEFGNLVRKINPTEAAAVPGSTGGE